MQLVTDKFVEHLTLGHGICPSSRKTLPFRASPLAILLLPPNKALALAKSAPIIPEWHPNKFGWSLEQHFGRIRFFIENPSDDPIKIWVSGVTGFLTIMDGHHRFLAAVITQSPTVKISYVGRPDLPPIQELLSTMTV